MAIDVHRTSGTARIHRFGIIDLVVLVVTNGLLINTRKQHINMKYKLFTQSTQYITHGFTSMRSLRTRRHDGQMVARENKCSRGI